VLKKDYMNIYYWHSICYLHQVRMKLNSSILLPWMLIGFHRNLLLNRMGLLFSHCLILLNSMLSDSSFHLLRQMHILFHFVDQILHLQR
jgi:hypothetical protein